MGILLSVSSLYNLLTRDSVPAGEPFPFKKLLFLAFASVPVPQRTSLRTYSVTCFVYVFIGRRVLRAEERIPGHVQRLIFGNDRVQVAQQGEVFGFDDPAHVAPTLARHVHIAHAGQPSGCLGPTAE